MTTPHLWVSPETPAFQARAAALAAAWGARLGETRTGSSVDPENLRGLGGAVAVIVGPAGLRLQQLGPDAPGPVRIDPDELARLVHPTPSRAQPLARAVGVGKGVRRVVDATAGLLGDAFLLAAWGLEVTAVERSPVLHEMQREALDAARADPRLSAAAGRITAVRAESAAFLRDLASRGERPDAVYLDPMHPPRGKAAAVKKEMRVVRLVVGDDADAGSVFAAALGAAGSRVVVKSPRLVRPAWLEGLTPVATHGGRAVTYAVYRPRVEG